MKNDFFQIFDTLIQPGEWKTVDIPTPGLYTQTPMHMPVHVINGKQKGPRLFVCAAIHGDEILGVEIIRRLLELSTLKRLKGTLVAVPVVNVYGFVAQSRYMPDRRDLNRTFPGFRRGSLTARVAYVFMNEIVKKCTHGIDLHTGAIHRDNYPQVRASLHLPQVKEMAKAFGAPVVVDSAIPEGSLRETANELKIPFIVYEAGEALRFNEKSVEVGVKGIINVMKKLDMLRPSVKSKSKNAKSSTAKKVIFSPSTLWVRAPISGMMRPFKNLGDYVQKGELLCIVRDPFVGEGTIVESPLSGIIVGQTHLPLVNAGQALFHIASPKKVNVKKMESQEKKILEEKGVVDIPKDPEMNVVSAAPLESPPE